MLECLVQCPCQVDNVLMYLNNFVICHNALGVDNVYNAKLTPNSTCENYYEKTFCYVLLKLRNQNIVRMQSTVVYWVESFLFVWKKKLLGYENVTIT